MNIGHPLDRFPPYPSLQLLPVHRLDPFPLLPLHLGFPARLRRLLGHSLHSNPGFPERLRRRLDLLNPEHPGFPERLRRL